MALSIVKEMDDIGRIYIPKELRRAVDMKEGSQIAISVGEDGSLILKPIKTNAVNEQVKAQTGGQMVQSAMAKAMIRGMFR